MVRSIVFFVLAGLCEIGGGYLVWLAVRDRKGIGLAVLGALLLVAYGFIPTLQPAHFSRVYAVYGAVFIVMAMAWGALFERARLDSYDVAGAAICLIGAAIMMYAPR